MAQKVTPTKTFYRDLGNLCRLCGNEPLYTVNIFSKSGQNKQLRDKIIKSTGLCVQNDGSSDVVCRKCESKNFRYNYSVPGKGYSDPKSI